MATVITQDGRNFTEEIILDDSNSEELNTIAVGDGTASVSQNNTSLDNEVFREDDSNAAVTIETTSTDGQIRCTVELIGGTSYNSTKITEFGIFTSAGDLFYRAVLDSAEDIQNGETLIYEFSVLVVDQDVGESNVAITNDGINFIADKLIGDTTDYINTIAVGDSDNTISQIDSVMFSELSRDDNSSGNVVVRATSSVGIIDARTVISAGPDANDEVSANTSISEFGILTDNGTLVLHEVRGAITLEGGDSQTFRIPFEINQ